MSIWTSTKQLASLWVQHKADKLRLAGKPDTRVDSGGTINDPKFSAQAIDQNKLRKVRNMRESGGMVAQLYHQKALMKFGTGVEFQAEDPELEDWLEETFDRIDDLILDIGEDATWFPYSVGELVETQGGDFSHVELAEPWTMVPQTDDRGRIVLWQQHLESERQPQAHDPSEIIHFVINKSSGRDRTGVSEVLRSQEEIEQFRQNQQAIGNAIQLHAYPQRHVAVGNDNAAIIDDNELRRVRNMFNDWSEDTVWVTGTDVEVNPIEAENFDFGAVTERDARMLASAIGVPVEMTNYGSDGLGSGMPAELRKSLLALQNEADRRRLADQFTEQVLRPVVERYSQFDADQDMGITIKPFLDDAADMAELIQKVGGYMRTNEVRERLDLPPEEDDDLGETYRKPSNVQAPEGETDDDGLPGGGLFGDDTSGGISARDGGTGNVALSDGGVPLEQYPEWERSLLELHQQTFEADAGTRILSFTESELPEFVKARLRDAIRGGAIFSDIESIPSDQRMQLLNFLDEELVESGGWTIDGLANRLQDLDTELSQSQAETIARTETASVVNTAREQGYEERGEDDDLFYWTGALDDRVTDACTWLIEQTNPHHGGDPVPMDRLKELIDEAPEHDTEMQDDLARPDNFVVHPQERKTFVRHIE